LLHIFRHIDYRKAVADKTDIGKRVKSILDAGQLVDDTTVLGLVSAAISSSKQIQNDGFVLDGYPRNLNQADQLQKLLANNGLALNAALCLDVSDSVLIDRICSTTHLSFPHHLMFPITYEHFFFLHYDA
jgi:adenylate kinase